MGLIEYETPKRNPPRLSLRVIAGLMGAGLMLPTGFLLVAATASLITAIDVNRSGSHGDALALALSTLVMLAMALGSGWFSLRLIILAFWNVADTQSSGNAESE